MATFNWTYVSDNSEQYQVGLVHGEQEGHVLIHVNGKIVTIDFNVRESKTYSFFLGHELCRIEFDQRGKAGTYYDFKIDRKVDTPLNQARKQRERKHLRQSLALVGGILGLMLLVVMLARLAGPDNPQEIIAAQLAEASNRAIAVVQVKLGNGKPSISYAFEADGKPVQVDFNYERSFEVLRGQVLPLASGDEFFVRYLPDNPRINLIDFNAPSRSQLERYRERVVQTHARLHPEIPRDLAACEVEAAYTAAGTDGLADVLYQEETASANPVNNKLTYGRLIRSVAYRSYIEAQCWPDAN